MHSVGTLALAAAPLFFVARADIDFDGDDIPNACRTICRPVVDLSATCDASNLFDNDDAREDEYERNEDQLRAQCFCTNRSFDVAGVVGQCADCIRQNARGNNNNNNNNNDDDDDDDGDDNDDHRDELEDLRKIMATCGFASTASYTNTADAAASTISVVATAPTAASQLTTTFSAGPNQATGGAGQGNDNNGNNNGGNNDNNGGGSSNNNNNNNNGDGNDDDDGPNSFAGPRLSPLGGLSGPTVLYSLGAVVAGVAVFVL